MRELYVWDVLHLERRHIYFSLRELHSRKLVVLEWRDKSKPMCKLRIWFIFNMERSYDDWGMYILQ